VSEAEAVLYADVLFLIDFSMDFLSLYAAGSLLSLRLSAARMSLAALLGALYSVSVTALYIGGWVGAAGALFLSALMARIAFGAQGSVVGFLRVTAAVWGCGALLGGAVTLLSGLFGGVFPGGGLGDILPAAAAAVWGFLRVLRGRIGRGCATLRIPYGENVDECRGLIDSGNLLTDPLSALPVILIAAREARRFAGDETDGKFRGIPAADAAVRGGIRVVPIRRGKDTKLLYRFLCAEVHICRGRRTVCRRAVVCVDHDADGYGGCEALLPASLL
jgi:stage II sporulation protein GA (sporulation sigma-E factor processing peptidase)